MGSLYGKPYGLHSFANGAASSRDIESHGDYDYGESQSEYQDYGYPHGSSVQEYDVFESSRYDIQSGMSFEEQERRARAAQTPKGRWHKVRKAVASGALKTA